MVTGQQAIVGIYKELERISNLPETMTFETNETQKLRDLKQWIADTPEEIFFSVNQTILFVH